MYTELCTFFAQFSVHFLCTYRGAKYAQILCTFFLHFFLQTFSSWVSPKCHQKNHESVTKISRKCHQNITNVLPNYRQVSQKCYQSIVKVSPTMYRRLSTFSYLPLPPPDPNFSNKIDLFRINKLSLALARFPHLTKLVIN